MKYAGVSIPEEFETAVVLLSGGMDSTTLAYEVATRTTEELIFLSVDYGQRHGRLELGAAMRTAEQLQATHHILDMTALGNLLGPSALTSATIDVPEGHYTADTMKATVVPNRNAILLSIAYGIAASRGADIVATAVHAGDHTIYPDCRPEFLGMFEVAMDYALDPAVYGTTLPRLHTPFVHMTKADIVTIGEQLSVNWLNTWTCYVGGEQPCGRCGTCVERLEAFDIAEVFDPASYVDRRYWREVVKRPPNA